MTWLERIGVQPVINATGPWTKMGNSALSADVRAAMDEAAQTFVPIAELQEAAGETIAQITGSEAGYVTSGAASAITLSVAACIAGEDAHRIWALPHISSPPDTVVMFQQSRWFYDFAVRATGAKVRTVDGLAQDAIDRLTDAIDHDVACVFHDYTGLPYRDPAGLPALSEIVSAAHKRGVPVVVDASMAVPPHSNLRDIVAAGADAVAFSGGKALQGPAASGFVACRRKFVRSIALQHQDLNVWAELTGSIDPGKLFMGIGRSHKISKEQIVGLVVALRAYADRDHAEIRRGWEADLREIESAVMDLPGTRLWWEIAEDGRAPYLMLGFDPAYPKLSTEIVSARLMRGTPRIFIAAHRNGALWIGPETLQSGQAAIVAFQLRSVVRHILG